MKYKYTEKQIVESIKHWQKQLQLMNENEVLNQLEGKFNNIIYSNQYNYKLNIDDLNFIQSILVKKLFDKVLERLPISIVSASYMKSQSKMQFKGRIQHSYRIIESNKIIIIPEQIQVVTFDGKDNLMKIVSVIAHELIHQYDYLYGNASIIMPIEKQMEIAGIKVKDPYDVHGNFFNYHMNRINDEFDLNVEISYDETNMKNIKRKNPIPVVDNTTMSESDSRKNDYIELAKYLSTSFVNDGSVQIEITNDGVKTWTI